MIMKKGFNPKHDSLLITSLHGHPRISYDRSFILSTLITWLMFDESLLELVVIDRLLDHYSNWVSLGAQLTNELSFLSTCRATRSAISTAMTRSRVCGRTRSSACPPGKFSKATKRWLHSPGPGSVPCASNASRYATRQLKLSISTYSNRQRFRSKLLIVTA